MFLNEKKLERLTSQQEQEAGQYQFQYNTEYLGQGMFYIVLHTADVISSSKLVIIGR